MSTALTELRDTLVDVMNKLEEIERWTGAEKTWPNTDSIVYFILESGELDTEFWADTEYHKNCLAMGNMFETGAEAEQEVEKRKLLVELKNFAAFSPDWSNTAQDKYHLYYVCSKDLFLYRYANHPHLNEVYFKSSKRANEALEHFGDRLKLLI